MANLAHLEDDCALKHNKHKEGEKGIVPVLVETPKANGEKLEDEEGRDCVLCKELPECRDRNVEVILAILPLMFVDDGLVCQSLLVAVV